MVFGNSALGGRWKHTDKFNCSIGQGLDHNLGNGLAGKTVIDGVVAVFDKLNGSFDVWDMLLCGIQNDSDIVVCHAVSEQLKFRVHMKVRNSKTCCNANLEGLIKGFTK